MKIPHKVQAVWWILWGYMLYKTPLFMMLAGEGARLLNASGHELSSFESSQVETLHKQGISQASVTDFGGDVATLVQVADQAKETHFSDPKRQRSQTGKDYLERFPYSTAAPKVLDLENPFVQLLLSDSFLNVVNNVHGMSLKLMNVNYWYCHPAEKAPILSQNWHRDWDDPYLLKVFIYINDVSEAEGAFQYIEQSHDHGPYGHVIKRHPIMGKYTSSEKLAALIPTKPTVLEGKSGSMVLCDTSGFHKGGYVSNPEGYRFLFYGVFTSSMASHPLRPRKVSRNFVTPADLSSLSSAAQFAVS